MNEGPRLTEATGNVVARMFPGVPRAAWHYQSLQVLAKGAWFCRSLQEPLGLQESAWC